MIAALCYRQWLAMRVTVLVAAILTLVVTAGFAVVASDVAAAQRLALHVRFTAFAAITLPFFIGASGFLRNPATGVPMAPHFTLSLPVAREHFWAVWLAMTWGAAIALLVAASVLQTGALVVAGADVPFASLARTTLFAAAGTAPLMAVIGVVTVLRQSLGGLVPFGIWLLLWNREWPRVMAFLAGADMPPGVVAAILTTTALAFGWAWMIVRTREF